MKKKTKQTFLQRGNQRDPKDLDWKSVETLSTAICKIWYQLCCGLGLHFSHGVGDLVRKIGGIMNGSDSDPPYNTVWKFFSIY